MTTSPEFNPNHILNLGGCPMTIRDIHQIVRIISTDGGVVVENAAVTGLEYTAHILAIMSSRLTDEDKNWIRTEIRSAVAEVAPPKIRVLEKPGVLT